MSCKIFFAFQLVKVLHRIKKGYLLLFSQVPEAMLFTVNM